MFYIVQTYNCIADMYLLLRQCRWFIILILKQYLVRLRIGRYNENVRINEIMNENNIINIISNKYFILNICIKLQLYLKNVHFQ